MKTYRIIAQCDPYNARRHYNGQKVLRYEGTTPVEWVMAYNLTEDQALDLLMKYADKDFAGTDIKYYDEDTIAAEMDAVLTDFGKVLTDKDYAWYKGRGYYAGGHPVFLEGAREYSCDSFTYKIEESL